MADDIVDESDEDDDLDYSASAGDGGSVVSAEQLGDNFYEIGETWVKTWYETYEGILPGPVAGPPGAPCRALRIHAPYTIKQVAWRVSRVGARPRVPHFDTSNANEVLMFRKIMPDLPELMKDEVSFIFRVSGQYTYLLLYPPTDQDSYATGTSPIVNTPPEALVLQGYQFDKSLLRCSPPAGFQGQGGDILSGL